MFKADLAFIWFVVSLPFLSMQFFPLFSPHTLYSSFLPWFTCIHIRTPEHASIIIYCWDDPIFQPRHSRTYLQFAFWRELTLTRCFLILWKHSIFFIVCVFWCRCTGRPGHSGRYLIALCGCQSLALCPTPKLSRLKRRTNSGTRNNNYKNPASRMHLTCVHTTRLFRDGEFSDFTIADGRGHSNGDY